MLFGPRFGAHNGLASDVEDSASCLLHGNLFALTCKHHILVIWLPRAAGCAASRQEAGNELGIQLYHL